MSEYMRDANECFTHRAGFYELDEWRDESYE